MKHINRYAAAVALILAIGCNNNDNMPALLQPLEFSVSREVEVANVQSSSRADLREEAFVSGDLLGLFGYFFVGSWVATDWADKEPNFINHDNLRDVDGYWTLGTPRYWPAEGNPQLRTFAYYPYNEACTVTYQTGYPSIEFAVADDSREQVDFMTANPSELWNKSSEVIKLSFKRQLARINFSVEQTGTKIEILKIECPEVFMEATGTFTDGGFEWSNLSAKGAVLAASDDTHFITSNEREQLHADFTVLLLPGQDIPAGSGFKLHYRNIYADNTTEDMVSTATLPAKLTIEKGGNYNIPFFVDNAYQF